MFPVLLPLLAAVSLPFPLEDPDLRCVVAISYVMGVASEKGAPADELTSLTTVFMYFLGKVDARHPAEDLANAFSSVFAQPGYEKLLPKDLVRCGAEAEARGAMLIELGKTLKSMAPLASSSPG